MDVFTSAAVQGISMTLWVLVYTASGAAVLALLAMLFVGFVEWGRPMGVAGPDMSNYMYHWPTTVSRGWIAFFSIIAMIACGLGAAFMFWVGAIADNIWISFISLALILPFLIMAAGLVFVAGRAFTWHAILVFFVMATSWTIFILGQVYVWTINNTLYSQLGAWFTIGMVLITPVWFYWAYVFARDNNELNTSTGLMQRYASTFHPDEISVHLTANAFRAAAHLTSQTAWKSGHNRAGEDPIANFVSAGLQKFLSEKSKAELDTLVVDGFKSQMLPLYDKSPLGIGVF
jgi:hypothetical protein